MMRLPHLKYCHSAASDCFSAKKTSSGERLTTCWFFTIYWHKRCRWPYSSLETYKHRDTNEHRPSLDSPSLHILDKRTLPIMTLLLDRSSQQALLELKRILIIDDEEPIRRLLGYMLQTPWV